MTKLSIFITTLLFASLLHRPASALINPAKQFGPMCKLVFSNLFVPDKGNYKIRKIKDGPMMTRTVKYQLPEGAPPAGGWPIALVFQGSFSPIQFHRAKSISAMGAQYESQLVRELLGAGYAVIAPRAIAGLGWQTNLPPFSEMYRATADYALFENLLAAIDRQEFGPLNGRKMFATGISSGGYNAQRVVTEFPNRFRAVAVHSASYMKCLGPVCFIPEKLPANHPPTLLISGEKDSLVPVSTVRDFYETLVANGIEARIKIVPNGEHEWFKISPGQIVNHFNEFLE